MRDELDILRPGVLVYGWLTASNAILGTLVVAALAQGVGAWLGGCRWIGLSLPVDRQVWALVNQPDLAFASQSRAAPYWLASVVVPVLVALILATALARVRSLAGGLFICHLSWSLAVIGGAFIPFLSADDGHLERWLHFAELPDTLLWIAPAAALAVALLAVVRLLSLGRAGRLQAGRTARTSMVLLHFVLPTTVWVALAQLVAGTLVLRASAAVLGVVIPACLLAWFRYPPAPLRGLDELRRSHGWLALGWALVLVLVVWFGGHPVGESRRRGLLWDAPSASNNVRSWIDPYLLFEQE